MGTELSEAERDLLVLAIGDAETSSRGEIRVHIEASTNNEEPLARARQLFYELKMHKTRDDTGVLLYVARVDRKVAVFAGAGIVGAAEPGFWQEVSDAVADGYKRENPLAGLRSGLEKLGTLLREHARGSDDAGNELPNVVSQS